MITDNVSRCITAVQTKRRAQENKVSLNAQATALRQLDAICRQVKLLLECAAAIQNSGIAGNPVLSESTQRDLLDSISTCGSAVESRSLSKDTVAVLASTFKTASNEVTSLWRQASMSYAEGPKGYLTLLGGLTSDPQGARMLSAKITEICEGMPTVQFVKSLVSNVEKAKEIIARFSLKPEIEVFLQKVSVQQATVFDLTPKVLDWLSEQGLTGKLKVNF